MLERTQKGSNVYAAYDITEPNAVLDKVSIMMINSNCGKRTGLAPIFFDSINGSYSKFLFDVTGRITLGEYLEKNLTQDEFRRLILNLVETIECFDEYMIDSGKVLLGLDSVYINMMDGTINFICIALKKFVQKKSLYGFFRDVVSNCYVNVDTNGISYFDCVRNVIRNESGFSLSNIKASLNTSKSNKVTVPPVSPTPHPEPAKTEIPKIEEPETITVSSAPVTNTPIQSVTTLPQKEKKGLFGGLFSSSKKKKTEQPGGFQGGIAGLKSGGAKSSTSVKSAVAASPASTPISQPTGGNPQSVPEVQQPMNFSGTTVLNGGKAVTPQPVVQSSSFERPGTTVLKSSTPDPVQPSQAGNMSRSVIKETTVLNPQVSYGSATTVLNKSMQKQCFLIRVRTHQRLQLNKPVIHIGRDLPELDFNITDNTNVGHRHANIVQRESGYCVIDLQSRNHTYLNDTMIESGKEYSLSNEDKIRFADEEFEFMIM